MRFRTLLATAAAIVVSAATGGYLGRWVGDQALSRVARQEWQARPSDETRYFVREMGMEVGLIVGGFGALSSIATGAGVWLLLGKHMRFVAVTQDRYQLFKRWADAVKGGDMEAQLTLETEIREGESERT